MALANWRSTTLTGQSFSLFSALLLNNSQWLYSDTIEKLSGWNLGKSHWPYRFYELQIAERLNVVKKVKFARRSTFSKWR